MKITIAGFGYVGKAVDMLLKQHHTTHIVDPAFRLDKLTDVKPDAIIICVSTPQGKDGSCDVSNVLDVLNDVNKHTPVLIKSTISHEGWLTIKEAHPDKQICFSPEFLRAKTAIQDFAGMDIMYLSDEHSVFWCNLFYAIRPDLTFKVGTVEELIITKYMRNSFLATKVNFFNQAFDLCQALGINFETVRQFVTDDSRIGSGHTKVTEDRGFGGHCFPKDTNAIIKTAQFKGVDLSIIREAVEYNNRIK